VTAPALPPNPPHLPSRPSWDEVEQWLDRAFERPEAERAAWLQAQGLRPELQAEVQELLQAEADSRGLLGDDVRPAPSLAVGDTVGAWRVEGVLGHGGSGDVYRVRRDDPSMDQVAALKLLRTSDDPDEQRRFAAERRLLARLQDPSIARLIDGGAHQGRLYAVLELVDGETLDRHVAGRPLADRLAVFRRVVAAVAYAHAQLVVHRDLKPANVMVTPEGQVRLLDFGIAKLAEGAHDERGALHTTLALRLTPAYCAPEQLQAQPVGPAADVYALGVMLYQVLTGELPWTLQGSGVQRAVQRLRELDAPPAPSTRVDAAERRRVQGDLDAIVAKCLRPQAALRYATADALAEDLRRWHEGLPVQARGDAPAYVLGRLMRRHRWALAAGAMVLASLVAGLVGVAWQARETARERDIAREEAASNKAVRDYLLTLFRVAGEQAAAGAEPGARAMLAQAAERLSVQLDRDPASAADTLLALAQLYFQLNDYIGAEPLFERLLQRASSLPPATVAQARLDLAQCLWRSGQPDRAAQLLAQAQAWWQRDPARWRNRLLESRLVQAQVARAQGHADEGLRVLEAALPERLALSGEQHVDTATLLNNLGLARYLAGDLKQARQDFERAWAIWQALHAESNNDGLNTLNNWAALELREGHDAQAERLFRQALELRRANLPPSAAQAALQNNLGKLMLRRGAADEALALLVEAVALGERFAGPDSAHTLAAMAGVAEAQTRLGRLNEAGQTLTVLERRARSHYGEQHLLTGMAELAQARWFAAQRQWPAAHARAARAAEIWQALGPSAAPYLAQVKALRAGWPEPPGS
jgi:eukaryotic-like serine/threonine-protein kinase